MGRNSIKNNTLAKRTKVKKIARVFFSCYNYLKHGVHFIKKEEFLEFSSSYCRVEFANYIERVEKAYEMLDPIHKMFIDNEFFHSNYPFWWEGKYSTSSFYRIKADAVDSFLRYFYEAEDTKIIAY